MWDSLLPEVVWPIVGWYFAVQICALGVAPLAETFLRGLPDRGYALAKVLGVLLVGYVLWMGTALGWLRNDTGGAWMAVALVAIASLAISRFRLPYRYGADRMHILLVEGLFALGLVIWAWVRAHDPAANHTEQPMDLMFLNSIWYSPTYPPQDAWFSGYAIAYYYFGYWLLATVGRLANTPPEIAYNAGQAAWFGLLLIGTYGIGYNLLSFRIARSVAADDSSANSLPDETVQNKTEQGESVQGESAQSSSSSTESSGVTPGLRSSRMGGLLAMMGVALTGNLQGVLEWLYANGAPVEGLARWVGVHNFPEHAAVTGQWYISTAGWWWWRSSRVIHDESLLGGHIEVIDEFPMFSYVLGDNHPHVLAMPVVLLVIGFAMNLLFWAYLRRSVAADGSPQATAAAQELQEIASTEDDLAESAELSSGGAQSTPQAKQPAREVEGQAWTSSIREWVSVDLPGGWPALVMVALAVGSLLFLNTWDFPPYWGLLVLSCAAAWAVSHRFPCAGQGSGQGSGQGFPPVETRAIFGDVAMFGGIVFAGALALYVPYLFTAQSQAGGLIPNFFHPTRISQFLVMFGSWVPALALLLWTGSQLAIPAARRWFWAGILVVGLAVLFLIITALLALGTEAGRTSLAQTPLPPAAAGYGPIMLERWLTQGYTFLLIGIALTVATVLLWQWYFPPRTDREAARGSAGHAGTVFGVLQRDPAAHARMGFALLLLFCGLVLVYLPEIVYLRDQFGWRMNTIFKFYYQAWLLFGLASAYIVVEHLRSRAWNFGGASILGKAGSRGVAIFAVVILGSCLIFPVTATYSKTGGFGASLLTLDATRYIEGHSPGTFAAMQWIREHVPTGATVLEAQGHSYSAEHNRVSTITGRPTLLGWAGHQRQWRGDAYGTMAMGRPEAIDAIFRSREPAEVRTLLAQWQIDYVYVSPVERRDYDMSEVNEAALAAVTELVFDRGEVRVYRTLSTTNHSAASLSAGSGESVGGNETVPGYESVTGGENP